MLKRFGWSAVAVALMSVALCIAPSSASAADGTFTSSPDRGIAGSSVTVTSTTPCPAPPSGTIFGGVVVVVLNGPGSTDVGSNRMSVAGDRSWSGSVNIAPGTRNGRYVVAAGCLLNDGSLYYLYLSTREFDVMSPPGQVDPAFRFAGNDRIATAIAASSDLYPSPAKVEAVVLSRSDSYADALAGTPLANYKLAPLLLTGRDTLDTRTEAEIARILPTSKTVYILGGTAAISDAVATSLANSGYVIVRLAGSNRYETAVKIADAIGQINTVLLTTGTDFRDGLVAGAAAGVASSDGRTAVLLTDGKTMPTETRDYLAANGSDVRFAIGAPAAAADPGATAIVGGDDADTSRMVAERFFPTVAAASIASVANFPDALSGGSHAAKFGAPLLLTDPGTLSESVKGYLFGAKSGIVVAYVYGGTSAVSESVRNDVVQAIT